MGQTVTDLVLSDAKAERTLVFTKAPHPWRLIVTLETDLGGICQRVLTVEDSAKLATWLREDPSE